MVSTSLLLCALVAIFVYLLSEGSWVCYLVLLVSFIVSIYGAHLEEKIHNRIDNLEDELDYLRKSLEEISKSKD